MDFNTIIENHVKFRDGKKLYRDNGRDRHKQGMTKASLSLQYFLGLERGFMLDKESNTIAIICQDVIVVLAFDTRELLIQWQMKIYTHLGEDQQFSIQISSSPPKAKLNMGPAKLHIQEYRFCLTAGVPPKLLGNWEMKHLRRFGTVNGRFCFEGGSLCGRGEGLYVFLTDQANEITQNLQLASEGKLKYSKRTLLNNVTTGQIASSREELTSKDGTRLPEIFNCELNHACDKETRRYEVDTINGDVRKWPSSETQADSYGVRADACSLAEFEFPVRVRTTNERTIFNWTQQHQLSCCVSCAGKLASSSRCATAANTPGSINFNPWLLQNPNTHGEEKKERSEKLSSISISKQTCHTSCISISQKSKYSDGSSSDRTECCEQNSFSSHSSAENISNCSSVGLLPPSNRGFWHASNSYSSSPPCRPPKPSKYRNQMECRSPSPPSGNKMKNAWTSHVANSRPNNESHKNGSNHGSPTKNSASHAYCEANGGCPSPSQFYDVPKNIGLSNKIFLNYDVPPSAVRANEYYACAAKTKMSLAEENSQRKQEEWFNRQSLLHPPLWLQFPFLLQCENRCPRAKMEENWDRVASLLAKESPVYAQVDLSKKMKNRLFKEANNERLAITDDHCARSHLDEKNMENLERLKTNLNYMNLEFSDSLKYYENVRTLLSQPSRNRTNGIKCSNVEAPLTEATSPMPSNSVSEAYCRCKQADESLQDNTTDEVIESPFENYMSMSSLKSAKNADAAVITTSIQVPRDHHDEKNVTDFRKCSTWRESLHCTQNNYDTTAVECNGADNLSRRCRIVKNSSSIGDSDSGLESDKLSRKNDDGPENLCHRKNNRIADGKGIRYCSSNVLFCKVGNDGNRDSSSSNDSGFSSGSLRYVRSQHHDYEVPLATVVSTKRHHSLNRRQRDDAQASAALVPQRSKSSDPLRDLTFHFHKGCSSSSPTPANFTFPEAERSSRLKDHNGCTDRVSPAEHSVGTPHVDCRSNSSGTSDMSDYIETLSLSSHNSHSSTDVHSSDGIKFHRSLVSALKSRYGIEYQTVDRASIFNTRTKREEQTRN